MATTHTPRTTTVAWICTDNIAQSVVEESKAQATLGYNSLVITPCVDKRTQARVVTKVVGGVNHPDARDGDLLIYVSAGDDPEGAIARRVVEVLQKEIKANVSFIRNASDSKRSRKLIYIESQQDFDKLFETWSNKPDVFSESDGKIPIIFVLALGQAQIESQGSLELLPAAKDALALSVEVIQLIGTPSIRTIPTLNNTETIVAALSPPSIPVFKPYYFPTHGDGVLLVIPTENKSKKAVLHGGIALRAPDGVRVHAISVPVESDVNEQPYNAAGAEGAFNRVKNALRRVSGPEYTEVFDKERIGTVIAASIENYIEVRNGLAVDFGIVVVHNAKTRKTVTRCSRGVTTSWEYVTRAKRFGHDGNEDHGNVTVGQVLAARVPGLDKADWHLPLAGHSRYELLSEAVREVEIPW